MTWEQLIFVLLAAVGGLVSTLVITANKRIRAKADAAVADIRRDSEAKDQSSKLAHETALTELRERQAEMARRQEEIHSQTSALETLTNAVLKMSENHAASLDVLNRNTRAVDDLKDKNGAAIGQVVHGLANQGQKLDKIADGLEKHQQAVEQFAKATQDLCSDVLDAVADLKNRDVCGEIKGVVDDHAQRLETRIQTLELYIKDLFDQQVEKAA